MNTILEFLDKKFAVHVTKEEWPEFVKIVKPHGVNWGCGNLEEYYGHTVALYTKQQPKTLTHGWQSSIGEKLPIVEFADFKAANGGARVNKFNIGDKVMIRYIDDMIAEYGTIKGGDSIQGPGTYYIGIALRRPYCGKIGTITKSVFKDGCNVVDLKWQNGGDYDGFPEWALCMVEKAKPKKQLSVAEIEKLLGYGVEVVREGK